MYFEEPKNELIKYGLYVIGGGSVIFGIIVLILFFSGSPQEAQEVREIPNEIEEDINEVKEELTEEGKNILSQLNEDRKRAVESEKDPYIKSLINMIFLYAMFMVIAIFVGIIRAISGIKLK